MPVLTVRDKHGFFGSHWRTVQMHTKKHVCTVAVAVARTQRGQRRGKLEGHDLDVQSSRYG